MILVKFQVVEEIVDRLNTVDSESVEQVGSQTEDNRLDG